MKRRYAVVGVGGRSYMYSQALAKQYADSCELTAICDTNPGRMDYCNEKLAKESGAAPVKTYTADKFDAMIREQKPDTVIVTTMDRFHDEYIVRALQAGCDAVTEKPMTISAEKCQRIVDTVKETGRKLTVTFNYRYSPPRSKVKEILLEGAIGRVLSVDFMWNLNTSHGADYFRRWHRNKANSGGLLVHKATHHFDLVNWWLASAPAEVCAFGSRQFYTPAQADTYGLTGRTDRCRTCPESGKCRFYLDLGKFESLKALYLDQERYDGYLRDRCVFSPDIDIEDSMNLLVRYDSGAMMSYSLNAFMPWEGYAISFNGTKGRLEHVCVESVYISGDGSVPGELIKTGTSIVVHPHFAQPYSVPIPEAVGGHGGGDTLLLNDIFRPPAAPDPLKRSAGLSEGAYSILTGIAGNESIRTGKTVRVADLVKNIPAPDYAQNKI